jgi:glycosyltransferase involved in cell wall biosynthesis
MQVNVDILLSVYNGGLYLQEQLKSIVAQTYKDWRLLVRDDGSTDESIEIIEQFRNTYPEKVEVVKDDIGNQGYNASFMELMKHTKADHIMLCDQDDYWYPEKITELLAAIQMEEKKDSTKGILVFSDVELTDDKLNITCNSFLRQLKYNGNKGNQVFFLKNYAPGCSIMLNKILLQQASKTRNIIGFHDQWLIMLAAATNSIFCLNKPLMKYRQHSNNAIGIKGQQRQSLMPFIKDSLKYVFQNKRYRELMYSKNTAQMQNICSAFPALVSKETSAFIAIGRSGYMARKLRSISKPYLIGRSFLEQLTYIICF